MAAVELWEQHRADADVVMALIDADALVVAYDAYTISASSLRCSYMTRHFSF
jgi:hypothetical protein